MFNKKMFSLICAVALFAGALSNAYAWDQAMGPTKIESMRVFQDSHPWGPYALFKLASGEQCNGTNEVYLDMTDANAKQLLSLLTAAKLSGSDVTFTVNDAEFAPSGQCKVRFVELH